MKFKMGDKVVVKERLISKLFTPSLIKCLKMDGVVIGIGSPTKVMFPNDKWYFISNTDLKLSITKNQQLLFNFME